MALQCFACGMDWHDANNIVQRGDPNWTNPNKRNEDDVGDRCHGASALKVTETDETIVIGFTVGAVQDESTLQQAGSVIFRQAGRAASANMQLIVDFRGVETVSSASLGIFALLNKIAERDKLDVRLVNVGANLESVFAAVGGRKVFRFIGQTNGADPAAATWHRPWWKFWN